MPPPVTFRTTSNRLPRRSPAIRYQSLGSYAPVNRFANAPANIPRAPAQVAWSYGKGVARLGFGNAVAIGILGYQLYQWYVAPGAQYTNQLSPGDQFGQWTVHSTQGYLTPPFSPKNPTETWEWYHPSAIYVNRNKNLSDQPAYDTRKAAEAANTFTSGDQTLYYQQGFDYTAAAWHSSILTQVIFKSVGGATAPLPSPAPVFYPVTVPGYDIPTPGPIPNTWGLPRPVPYQVPQWVWEPAPEPISRPVRANSPRPGGVTGVGLDISPTGHVSFPASVKGRAPSKTKETKFGAFGTAGFILVAAARSLGEAYEWLEVLAAGFGFIHKPRFFAPSSKRSRALQMADHIAGASASDWSWDRFHDALTKKLAEDVAGGLFFKNLTKSLAKLDIDVPYKLTGI